MVGKVVSTLFYLLSVPALGKTKRPSGRSQAVFSTLVTNKQTNIDGETYHQFGLAYAWLLSDSTPAAKQDEIENKRQVCKSMPN